MIATPAAYGGGPLKPIGTVFARKAARHPSLETTSSTSRLEIFPPSSSRGAFDHGFLQTMAVGVL